MNEIRLDFGTFLRILLTQSKLIISIFLFFCALGLTYYFSVDRVYRITSLIQVDNPRYSANPQEITNILFSGGQESTSLSNQIVLYNTRSNILDLIKELSLNISINQEDSTLINMDKITFKDELKLPKQSEFELSLEKDFYVIDFDGVYKSRKIPYGEKYEDDFIIVNISLNKFEESIKIYPIFTRSTYLVSLYQQLITIQRTESGASLYYADDGILRVTYPTNNPSQGIKVINKLNEIYIERNLALKSAKASKAIRFINDRIADLETQLDSKKDALNNFLTNNASVDIDIETSSILESLSKLQSDLVGLELEGANIQGSYTSDNPIYKNLLVRKNIIREQIGDLESRIKDLPKEQQAYIDLFKDVQISEEIYSELQNRKLGFSIQQASTIGNIRVIDEAYNMGKVSPTIISVIFFAFIGVLVSLITAILRGLYFTPITNPAEIEDKNLSDSPILAIIPFVKDKDDMKEVYSSLESMVLNLRIDQESKGKIILLTSPSASNGKSFVSREFAKKLSNLGHKTILLDADFKRGDQHKEFEGINRLKVDEIKKFQKENISDLKVSDNFYVMPKIKNLKNSFQFVDSQEFRNVLTVLKEEFDFIVIDTAPILSISDTSALMMMSDKSILLTRHALTKPAEVAKACQIAEQVGVKFDGIVYNSYQKPSGYYGYYQYYGNYSYQYYADRYLYKNYDYDKD